MTVLSNNDIARAIYLSFKDKSVSEQVSMSKKVVEFLFRRRILSRAPLILSQLTKIVNHEEGRIVAKVSSALKLSHQDKIDIENSLKKRYSAKEIILSENLDQKLLGGIKVEVNNEVIDLSIKNKIEKLQEHLTKSV
ncbi:MAG: ATP synthase F1 subunit delta [bacterium]